MKMHSLVGAAAALSLLLASSVRAATPLPAFTAQYAVAKHGSRIGEATLSLQRSGNDWTYVTKIHGTSGLASLLNVTLDETSRFRWRGDVPEMLSYDYQLDSVLKRKQRHATVDWRRGQVQVHADNHKYQFGSVAGMVERHSAVLAIGAAVCNGATNIIILPVATRDHVEHQQYTVSASQAITVPAGRFDAVRVQRADSSNGISAWYALSQCAAPVKLEQGNGKIVLSLLRVNTSPAH